VNAVSTSSTNASAKNYYVTPTGSDNSLGTVGTPFRTIQKAVNIAQAGDTILVRGGAYKEYVIMRRSGVQGKPITLKNYPGEAPILDGALQFMSSSGAKYPIGWIVVEGFEIINGTAGLTTTVRLDNAHDVIIRGNKIRDAQSQGIQGNGYKITIDRNIISHAGSAETDPSKFPYHHGMYLTGASFIITNNVIHSNLSYGIQVAAFPYDSTRHAGPEFAGAKDWLISNNTFAYQKYRSGIVLWQTDAKGIIIQNNVFYDNGPLNSEARVNGITIYTTGGGHIIRNNVFFSSINRISVSDSPSLSGASYTGSNNIQQDPSLANPQGFDFRLRSTSPAIDSATSQMAPSVDIIGNRRPLGIAPDIGAYEFVK
jgi:hypothetical protein